MHSNQPAYQISALGDTALLVSFGNIIDEDINRHVLARTGQLKKSLQGVIEIVSAYCSISIYADLYARKKETPAGILVLDHLRHEVEKALNSEVEENIEVNRTIRVPVCYAPGFSNDLAPVAAMNDLTTEELISLHSGKTYRVFMLGFLPGFCYLGETDQRVFAPRKTQPAPVSPGAIGIAGRQTGIYPLASPGGWQIIGRTPLRLFDSMATEPTLFRAGDRVELFSISSNDFFDIQNNSNPYSSIE